MLTILYLLPIVIPLLVIFLMWVNHRHPHPHDNIKFKYHLPDMPLLGQKVVVNCKLEPMLIYSSYPICSIKSPFEVEDDVVYYMVFLFNGGQWEIETSKIYGASTLEYSNEDRCYLERIGYEM